MCEPATLMAAATLAIGAASSGATFMGQQQQYEAQADMYKQNIRSAQDTARDQYAHSQNASIQQRNAAAMEKFNTNTDTIKAAATAEAAAVEGGVQGNSISSLIASYYGQQGRYNDAIDQNYQMNRDYIYASMDQTKNQTQSQINSMAKPTKPSFLDASIRIASAGLEAGNTYYSMKKV